MTVQPYLFFDGRCEEAIKFYEKALNDRARFVHHSFISRGFPQYSSGFGISGR